MRLSRYLVVVLCRACAEFFGMRNGQEYILCHYLFRKPATAPAAASAAAPVVAHGHGAAAAANATSASDDR